MLDRNPSSNGDIVINYIEQDLILSNIRLPKVLIMGGDPLQPTELVDMETGRQCDFPDNGIARPHVLMAVTNDRSLAFCGGSGQEKNCHLLKVDGTWETKANFFTKSKEKIAATIVPNYGWFFAGSSDETSQTDLIDLQTYTLTQGPNLMYPSFQQSSMLQVNDTHTLMIGGRRSTDFLSDETWFYDWTKGLEDSWIKYHNLNEIRVALSAGINNEGLVLAVGGFQELHFKAIQTSEKINLNTDSAWTYSASLPDHGIVDSDPRLLVVYNRFFLLGGRNTQRDVSNKIWEFHANENKWTEFKFTFKYARRFFTWLIIPDSIFQKYCPN